MKQSKFALEDYISFFDNPTAVKKYSMHQLHEILYINGFIKFKTKGKVIANLEALEMIDPRRCTLRGRAVFPFAPLTVEEVKADVRSIGWEDCPIGSIQAVGSAVEEEEVGESTNLSRPISSTTASSSIATVGPLRLKKRRKKAKPLALIAA